MASMWPECFSYLIIYKLYENDIYHLIITHEVCLCVMIFYLFFLDCQLLHSLEFSDHTWHTGMA